MIDKNNRIRKEIVNYGNSYTTKYIYNCLDCSKEIRRTAWEEDHNSWQYCSECVINHRLKRIDSCKFDENGNKFCKGCDRFLSTNKFLKKGNEKKGFSTLCSKCHNLKQFGINSVDYENLLLKQDNKCAICNNSEPANDRHQNYKRSLAVDHDHISGEVRGLLCTNCNTMLGQAKDNIEILQKAIDYLKRV